MIQLNKKLFYFMIISLLVIILFLWLKPNSTKDDYKSKYEELEKREKELEDSAKIINERLDSVVMYNNKLSDSIIVMKNEYDKLNADYIKNKKSNHEKVSNDVRNADDNKLLQFFSKYK